MMSRLARPLFLLLLAGCTPIGSLRETRELIAAHNRLRARHHLPPLAFDARLQQAAEAHARDMARRGRLSHTGSDGSSPSDRIARAGYRGLGGENVAWNYPSAGSVMLGWEHSAGHLANILGNYRHLGAAHVDGPTGPYWAVDFAAPAGTTAAADESAPIVDADETTSSYRPAP